MIDGLRVAQLLAALALTFVAGHRLSTSQRGLRYQRALEGRIATKSFTPGGGKLPYYRQRFLCSDGEFRFYRELRAALGEDWDIWPKVRVASVVGCRRDDWAAGYGAPIAQKEFDFVLVKPGTSRAVAAVELDDRTHDRADRRARDEFLNEVCRRAQVPLIRVRVQHRYDRDELRRTVGALALSDAQS